MAAAEMSFWEHLGALRDVLLRIAAVVLGLGIAAFCLMPWIFDHVILAPCDGDFILYRALSGIHGDGAWIPDLSGAKPFHVDIINIELASQFFIHMSASVWLAFILAFPFVLYQLWGFVAPALYPAERRHARSAFLFGNVMFYLGMAVGYFIVFPLALRFLADYQLSERIANTVSLTSYMDSFFMLVLMMGLVFELPLLAWLLGRMGLLRRPFFKRYRKFAAVGILVLAGVITPTSDLFTLLVVFIPIYALWEASALLVPRGKDKPSDDQNQKTPQSPT